MRAAKTRPDQKGETSDDGSAVSRQTSRKTHNVWAAEGDASGLRRRQQEARPRISHRRAGGIACRLAGIMVPAEIDALTLARFGAEALVRMRHPTWGVVPPGYFIPEDDDPDFLRLSEFVIDRAMADWRYLLKQQSPIDISINLPVSFLSNRQAVRDLCQRMPTHPAFGGLLIEINSIDVIRNLDLLIDVTTKVRLHNIAVSINDVGADWPALMELDSFPFVELKVDRQFVTGCATDRLKRTVCRRIIELANGYGAT